MKAGPSGQRTDPEPGAAATPASLWSELRFDLGQGGACEAQGWGCSYEANPGEVRRPPLARQLRPLWESKLG